MKKETEKLIHDAFAEAMEHESINIVEMEKIFYSILENAEVCHEDQMKFDYFLGKVERSINARIHTHSCTNMTTDVLHACVYIIKWLNDRKNKKFVQKTLSNKDCIRKPGFDADIIARRKGWDREMQKNLEAADKLDPTPLKDLFGIHFTILNTENSISLTCYLVTIIVSIICNLNRSLRAEFIEYMNTIDSYSRRRVLDVLNIPFILEPLRRTDDPKEFNHDKYPEIDLPTDQDRKMMQCFKDGIKFYFDPKKNGYQAIHIVLAIDATSEILPGFQMEVQFQTRKMELFSNNHPKANHKVHEEKRNHYAKIFNLSDEEIANSHLRAFDGYDDGSNRRDTDGLRRGKVFYQRRINEYNL